MRKFFVTGGAGFIGSAFVRLLLDEFPDAHVTNFDALTYAGNLDNLAGLDPARHRFLRGDICDARAVLGALDVDLLGTFGAVGEDEYFVVADLHEPAVDQDRLLLAPFLDP